MLKLPFPGAGKQQAQHAFRARIGNQLPQQRKPWALQRQRFTASSPSRQRQVPHRLTFSALEIPLETAHFFGQFHSTMQHHE